MGEIRGRPLNILRLFYDNNKDSVLPNGRITRGGGWYSHGVLQGNIFFTS